MGSSNIVPIFNIAVIAIHMVSFNIFFAVLLITTNSASANHPSSHGHHGSHHHMHHSHHHPRLVPPSSSSVPISQTYVHQYSYNLPGSGSYFKMNRVYARPFLPSFVGNDEFRSSHTALPEDQPAQSELGRLKGNALLSSLSFLPDDFQNGEENDQSQNQEDNNNSTEYHNPKYDPFNPRYAVGRVEVSDEEWEAEMQEDFETSGLMHTRGKRGILSKVPKGLVNINFGTHTCVHMGTELKSSDSAYAPTAISYPIDYAESPKLHTVLMVDLDHESTKGQNSIETSDKDLQPSHMYLHWMVINIPGSKVDDGQTITSYKGPTPKPGSGVHRYVIVAYEQKSDTPMRIDHGAAPFRTSFPCQETGRLYFDLENFRSKYNMSEHPIAANYFQVQYDEFVDNIDQSCSVSEKDVGGATQDNIALHSLPILNSRFL